MADDQALPVAIAFIIFCTLFVLEGIFNPARKEQKSTSESKKEALMKSQSEKMGRLISEAHQRDSMPSREEVERGKKRMQEKIEKMRGVAKGPSLSQKPQHDFRVKLRL